MMEYFLLRGFYCKIMLNSRKGLRELDFCCIFARLE